MRARRNRRLSYAYSPGNRTLDGEAAIPTNRREQLLQLYHLALAREGEDRNAFLADACAGDEELRHELEALLSREPPSDFLDASAAVPELALAGTGAAGDLTGHQIGPAPVT